MSFFLLLQKLYEMVYQILFILHFILLPTFSGSQNVFNLNEKGSGQDTTLNVSKVNNVKGPIISFDTTTHDVGVVMEGSNISYAYRLTNMGDEVLLISGVRTSCNCTVASFPKTPILPNHRDTVVLSLDTKHLGSYKKVAAVYSNANNNYDSSINKSRVMLNISWTVLSKVDKEK